MSEEAPGDTPARHAPQTDCIYCRIIAGELPSTKVGEGRSVLAIRDIAPRAPTHVLILAKEHIASAAELGMADAPLLGEAFELATEVARAEGVADAGYRIVTNIGTAGGQTIPHLHFHLLGGRSMAWPPG